MPRISRIVASVSIALLLLPVVTADTTETVDTTAYSGNYLDFDTQTEYYYDEALGTLTPIGVNTNVNAFADIDIRTCRTDTICTDVKVAAVGNKRVSWTIYPSAYVGSSPSPCYSGTYGGQVLVTAVAGSSTCGLYGDGSATGILYINGVEVDRDTDFY